MSLFYPLVWGDDMIKEDWARRAMAWCWLALALMIGLPEVARAQSSAHRSIAVPFAAPVGDGYAGGSVTVQYAFLACFGELHLALRLAPGSARSNGVYRMGGKTYTADGAPQISVAKIRGHAARAGSELISSFTNGAVGPEGGLGCFSGDLTQLGVLTRWLGPKPSQEQIVNFLNSLTLTVEPIAAVRDTALEARLQAQDRQRQAVVEAQQKAQRDAAEARRVAEAKRAEQAARPISRNPTGAGGGYGQTAPAASSVARAPELSREQRIANAIASDKVLADQRLQEQRRAYAQQQQAMADAQQRQNEALAAAAPAMMELGAGIYGAIENFDARLRQRQYQNAQAKMAGKCKLPNGLSAPKDGDLQFGVEISASLGRNDCGDNPSDRFKAFQLELDQPARVRLTVRPSLPWVFTSFQIFVNDIEKTNYGRLTWRDWGGLQKTNSLTIDLPAGIYVVEVSNGVEDIFAGFVLRVDKLDAQGRTVAAAPPPPAPAAPTGAATIGPVIAGSTTTAGAAPPALGVSIQTVVGQQRVRVLAVQPGSSAAFVGLRPGDELLEIRPVSASTKATPLADAEAMKAYIASAPRPSEHFLTVVRGGGQPKVVTVKLASATAGPAARLQGAMSALAGRAVASPKSSATTPLR